jgi:hypothetical protein
MHIQACIATGHVAGNRAGILNVFAYVCLYMHVLEIHKEAQCIYLHVSVCICLYMSVYD